MEKKVYKLIASIWMKPDKKEMYGDTKEELIEALMGNLSEQDFLDLLYTKIYKWDDSDKEYHLCYHNINDKCFCHFKDA